MLVCFWSTSEFQKLIQYEIIIIRVTSRLPQSLKNLAFFPLSGRWLIKPRKAGKKHRLQLISRTFSLKSALSSANFPNLSFRVMTVVTTIMPCISTEYNVIHESNLKSTSPVNKCNGTWKIYPSVVKENCKVYLKHCVWVACLVRCSFVLFLVSKNKVRKHAIKIIFINDRIIYTWCMNLLIVILFI